jgi:hypothetical protein
MPVIIRISLLVKGLTLFEKKYIYNLQAVIAFKACMFVKEVCNVITTVTLGSIFIINDM